MMAATFLASLPEKEQEIIGELDGRFSAVFLPCYESIHRWCRDQIWRPVLHEGKRDRAEQRKLFSIGRIRKDGKWIKVGKTVTNAGPDNTPHVWGMAVDTWLLNTDEVQFHKGSAYNPLLHDNHDGWRHMAEFIRSHGLTTGGDFRSFYKTQADYAARKNGGDWPHAEMPHWQQIVGLKKGFKR